VVEHTMDVSSWLRKQLEIVGKMLRDHGRGRPREPESDPQKEEIQNEAKNEANEVHGQSEEPNPNADLLKSLETLDRKLQEVEYKFISRAEALSDDKYYSVSDQIYLKLIWLNGEVGTGAGDVAGGVDYPPTDAALAALQTIDKELTAAHSDYQNLLGKDIAAFNRSLVERNITPVVSALDQEPPPRDAE